MYLHTKKSFPSQNWIKVSQQYEMEPGISKQEEQLQTGPKRTFLCVKESMFPEIEI
jgi:hypothetical protein